jgi:formate dehydrogenase subunit delta
MDTDHLVLMANRIGEFFQAMPDRAEALEGIANHLQKFWEPRMRRELFAHVDGRAGEGLLPIVLEAVTRHRPSLTAPGH